MAPASGLTCRPQWTGTARFRRRPKRRDLRCNGKAAYNEVLDCGQAQLPQERLLARALLFEGLPVGQVKGAVVANEPSYVGLDPIQVDEVVLALNVVDHVVERRNDVELGAPRSLDLRDVEALGPQRCFDRLLEDESGTDLVSTNAVQADILPVVRESTEQGDRSHQVAADARERRVGAGVLYVVGAFNDKRLSEGIG